MGSTAEVSPLDRPQLWGEVRISGQPLASPGVELLDMVLAGHQCPAAGIDDREHRRLGQLTGPEVLRIDPVEQFHGLLDRYFLLDRFGQEKPVADHDGA